MPSGQQEPSCQLYVIIPPDLDHDVAVSFAESGSLGNVACALLQCGPDGLIDRDNAAMLLRFASFSNIPLLFENDIAAAAELGASGVHIPADEERYGEARKRLGDNAIIGVDCGLSRHDALTIGELGADYVAFRGKLTSEPNALEMGLEQVIAWWSETVVVPCIAWSNGDADAARRLAQAGADFVAVGEAIWSHPDGPAAATAEFRDRLAEQRAIV